MDRLFFTALLSALLFLGSVGSAQADLGRKVNCDAGQSLTGALEASDGYGGKLNITVSGTCEESITIDRDRVNIMGEDGAIIIGRIAVFGPANVTLQNLAITGPSDGIVVRAGRTRILGCTIYENEGVGVVVRDGAWVLVRDSYISDNAELGILADNAQVEVENGRIAGNADVGFRADRQGSIVLQGTVVVEDNTGGIELWLHSTLDLTGQTQVQDNGDVQIYAVEDSAIRVSSGDVSVPGLIVCDDDESSFLVREGAEEAYVPYVSCSDFN